MSATKIFSKLRRSTPQVVDCFRNANFYHREKNSNGYPPEMIVLFTWLGAKQKYAHKFANCWTKRGHDVLHVTTSVRDLLFPKTGAEVTASRVVDFLDRSNRSVIIHGLSVGSYLTQLVLLQSKDSALRVTHQLFDSFTTCSGIDAGVENAVSPKYQNIAKKSIKIYKKYADLSSINRAENFALNSPPISPVMFIHSLSDQVAPYSEVVPIINAAERVAPVRLHIIPKEDKVPHVTIMKCLGEEKYMGMLYNFIEEFRDPCISEVSSSVQHSFNGKTASPNMNVLT